MSACTESGCGGTVLADGYCDTCGLKAKTGGAAPAPAGSASASVASATPAAARRSVDMAMVGRVCPESGCGGTVLADGYCNTCGLFAAKPTPVAPAPVSAVSAGTATQSSVSASSRTAPSIAAPAAPVLSTRLAQSTGSSASRRSAASRRSGTGNVGLGYGLVDVAPTVLGDPAAALMSDEKIARVLGVVPEGERYCTSCGRPVGRAHEETEGRVKGFCGTCRTQFDFITNAPALQAGEVVAGQYEILGPIAHGGMGWIYLGRDSAVSDRWVVLKGLLNENDPDAAASAVAERQFLAQIEHGSIVNIYNFVTHAGAGYIVMEYVGGQSLNSKLKDRRRANQGQPNPLPVDEAIAYILGVLPALGYLHGLGLVYNDLKPANIMATGADVKLIDVGGVMRVDDQSAAIFGTQGFQAPEVASSGPSVASDLFTVGRTLAVMTLVFPFHEGDYLHALPPTASQPLLARRESYHRFLLKATAAHPDDRFQTAEEMRMQLLGVLREIVSVGSGAPHPTLSALFGGDQLTELLADDNTSADSPNWRALPKPTTTKTDPAAGFLIDLPEGDPQKALGVLASAVNANQVPWTIEGAILNSRLLVELGQDPEPALATVRQIDPWDWRITWIRATSALRAGNAVEAAEDFSQVWTQLPGEIAPKLAVAVAAEAAGQFDRAAGLYDSIVATDPTYVSAAFGLARCRRAEGDRSGAVQAYERVPISSAGYFDAQLAQARTLTKVIDGAPQPQVADLRAAAEKVERLQLDSVERTRISTEILEDALSSLQSGTLQPVGNATLFGEMLNEDGLRSGLSRMYRELARVASTPADRDRLVDLANETRPRSFV